MSSTVDELTISYTDDEGTETVKELEKHVLTKGAWSTLLFKHQDLNRTSGEYGAPKVTIKRYQKKQGVYQARSKFTISSEKQAKEIMTVLGEWFAE
jgi:hypothetical protein